MWPEECNVEFQAWPKIPRTNVGLECVITEKIDGTNACIIVETDSENNPYVAGVQSRKRLITPDSDNMGFANWVNDNKETLAQGLGHGYHYAEWAGPGIQKNPHNLEQKTFFLFNTERWREDRAGVPPLCSVVPVLYEGLFEQGVLDDVMMELKENSDELGYKAEGVIVYMKGLRTSMKCTFEFSEGKWKGESND